MAIIVDNKTSAIEKIHTLNCLNEVERLEQFLTNKRSPQNPPYDYKIPPLPEWTNEDLEFEGQIINLKKMACNCDHSQTKKGLYHQNDLRLICNHIFDKILSEEKYMNIFDELTLLLMQSVLMNDEKMLIISRNITGGSTFYIGGNKGSNIYNIYAETNNKWKKYSYSTKNNKWSYDNFPNNPKMILETLKRNEFIFSKYLGVE